MSKRPKQKTWDKLKEEKCPKCGSPLTKGMFDNEHIQCANACGFVVRDDVKDLLVQRDHNEQ